MYFLAIVSQEDLLNGNIAPSYILCQSHGTSEDRAPWRVYRANSNFANSPKVLVPYPSGNQAMIDFLSHYRTRDHRHRAKYYNHVHTKKYYPKGALFWFECNEYGEVTGPAVFVKNVPDKTITKQDNGKERLEEALSYSPSVNELFSRNPWAMDLLASAVKPKLWQACTQVCNND
jgi:hypothetical protein